MNSNPSHESLDKTLTKIIKVMRNIGLTTSLDSTTSTPKNIGKKLINTISLPSGHEP